MSSTNPLSDRVLGPRRIAVVPVPVRNEDAPTAAVLDKLGRVVDEVMVVDDDAVDGTAAAYRLAFDELADRLADGTLSPDDLVVTLDPAGRLDLDLLDDLQRLAVKERLDALLVRRDPSGSLGWRLLNALVSAWASLWAGRRLHDAASGYRIFRLAPLSDALDVLEAIQAADGLDATDAVGAVDRRPAGGLVPANVELAVAMGRLHGRIRNDVLVAVPASRTPQARLGLLAALVVAPVTAVRVVGARRSSSDRRHGGIRWLAPLTVPLTVSALVVAAGLALIGATWRRARR